MVVASLLLTAPVQVTERCQNPAGPNALFGDEFVFQLDCSTDDLQLSVYDQAGPKGPHDGLGIFMASARVRVRDLMDSQIPIERWVPLTSARGDFSGRVRLVTRFVPRSIGVARARLERELTLRVHVPSGRETTVKTTHGATVGAVQQLLEQSTGIPARLQLLNIGRTVLESGGQLHEYGLRNHDRLQLSMIDDKALLNPPTRYDMHNMTDPERNVAELIEARGKLTVTVMEGREIRTLDGVNLLSERGLQCTVQLGKQLRSTKIVKTREANPKWKESVVLQLGSSFISDHSLTVRVLNVTNKKSSSASDMVVGTGSVSLTDVIHLAQGKNKLEHWIQLHNGDRMMGWVNIVTGFVPAPKDVVLMASERRERSERVKGVKLTVLLPDSRTCKVQICIKETVETLLMLLEQRTAIPAMQQSVSFGRRVLQRGVRLERYVSVCEVSGEAGVC